MRKIYFLGLLLILFAVPFNSKATHLRAADISVVKVDCSSLTYKIKVVVYVNTTSTTPVGGFTLDDGHLSFGDGVIAIIPNTPVTARPDLGRNIGIATIEFEHTYSQNGMYKINYFERDRSSGIINIAGAFDVAYSTYISINAIRLSCNSFPVLTVAPLDRACKGQIFFHNAGATDQDGDSLSYALSVPSKNSTSFVDGYTDPADRRFYTNFNNGNEAGDGVPSFSIDPETGLIRWDAPGMQGEYNIAFKILEWRRNPQTGVFFLMSETVRDMQIVVEDCLNKRPRLIKPANVCIEAGKLLQMKFIGTDPDNHPVKIEFFSAVLDGPPEAKPGLVFPVMTIFEDVPAEVNFEWQTDCIHVRDQVYDVIVKITDDPPSGPRLVTFDTWTIKVIAPPPVWVSIVPDLVNRTAQLEWLPYGCENAEVIQVWRKVGSVSLSNDVCVAGLSPYKGYELIAELPPGQTAFTDGNNGKKLAVAAQYCYRLVAVFANPAGGKSYVSLEVCMEPIRADAPVITHVSVQKTGAEDGIVRIQWMSPFDISKTQYPEPYEYEVYRDTGFSGNGNPVNISGRLKQSDHLMFDDAFLNTRDHVFNYRVVLYSRTESDDQYHPIDTSSMASTVRLSAAPDQQRIHLSWLAEVPWSNTADADPWHLIYRGDPGDPDHLLTLIDSVNVLEEGFEYTDTGKFNNESIVNNRMYCYAIVTKGTYGNTAIPLMRNHSQKVCLYPVNDLHPCVPQLDAFMENCAEFLALYSCGEPHFNNEIHWQAPEESGCRQDIISYNISRSQQESGDYELVATGIVGATYSDEDLESFAMCYRVQSIDSRGVVSEWSDPICNDNCPYFELPNVFSPNGDGCNDLFSAINGRPNSANSNCEPVSGSYCPAFVNHVRLKVMNRWGRLLYEYDSQPNNSVFIDWDGRDSNGDLLESGVYYYVANVSFETIDPNKRSQVYKGWINIIR